MAVKSALHARYKMDENKEESGVWVNFGGGDASADPPVPDIKVRIRRLKSRASLAVRAELDKPHTSEIRRGALDSKVYEELLLRQLAKGVIVDWQGVPAEEDGAPVPYSPDVAYKVLKDLPEFRDEILAIAMERDVFKAAVEKEAEENLLTT